LPVEALNGEGWRVREEDPHWIPIVAPKPYRHRSYLNATLHADGTLAANLQTSDDGYSALEKRHALHKAASPEAFVQEVMLEGLEAARIDSCALVNETTIAEPLKTEIAFSVSGYARVAGDSISFNPMPIGRLEENPLRWPERSFPVDMAYPRHLTHTLQMTLPPGYTVRQVPRSKRILLPDKGGHFLRVVNVEDGVLSIQTQFVIRRAVFGPALYPALRSFYEQVIAAEAEVVTLSRVAASQTENLGPVKL